MRYKAPAAKCTSRGLAFDVKDYTDFQAVYLSPAGPCPHLWLRKAGADSYPTSAPSYASAGWPAV